MIDKSEAEIKKTWKTSGAPIVSVSCIAYNHEKYIAEAIESILLQETDFPFEILVHDDASKDATQEIIREYAKRYPTLIIPILQTENQWLGKGIHATATIVWPRARGKYIAWCEGDDYWIDAHKLQVQANYLERHQECVLCFTNAKIIDEKGNIVREDRVPVERRTTLTQKDIIAGYCPPSNTMMFRRNALRAYPAELQNVVNWDFVVSVLLLQHGDAGYIDCHTAVYRMHRGGLWSQSSKVYRAEQNLKTRRALQRFFGDKYGDILGPAIAACERDYAHLKKIEIMENSKVKNIIISGTNYWNPGDDFVRDGVVSILRELFCGYRLNLLFYNFNQDFFPQSKFSGISNTIGKGDLEKCSEFIDAVVIAGLSAGTEIKDLYQWVIDSGLQDRVYLIGAGYENQYVERYIHEEPESVIFRNAKIIIGRTKKTPSFITNLDLPYHHLNCPAILSVPEVKKIRSGKKIEKIGFSIQLPHETGVPNHCCAATIYALSVKILMTLQSEYAVEVVAHHKSEYFHFFNLLKQTNIPVVFSSFYQESFDIYAHYDLVITTRLHSSLFANGHGIPGIIINDTDRHTHCLEGFPHSVWVNSENTFAEAFQTVLNQDLAVIALEAEEFKRNLRDKYLLLLANAFGVESGPGLKNARLKEGILKSLAARRNKLRVLAIIEQLTADRYLSANIETFKKAVTYGEGWFDSLVFLNWYGHNFRPKNYLEVGVRRGRSMAQVVKESAATACYGFDMWIRDYAGEANEGPDFVRKELVRCGMTKEPCFTIGNSHETLFRFWRDVKNPQRFELMYIDGDHSYEGAKADLDIAFEHLADGGALVFDDTRHVSHKNLWSLWQEYKAKYPGYLFLEDNAGNGTACAFKPPFDRLAELLKADTVDEGAIGSAKNRLQVFMREMDDAASLPIHFFTIVLNGQPFVRRHVDIFRQLPFRWYWHIIEGVADLTHDTSWSLQNGGKITDALHASGLSNDGTTEYLDALVRQYPDRVTVYRKSERGFWDGKIEMVNAPLPLIQEECLLFQIDVDEMWSVEQLKLVRGLFLRAAEKTAAYYYCRFFVGPKLMITTRNTYGNRTEYEWLRTWRYVPGDRWLAHEPPRLCRKTAKEDWQDVAAMNPYSHAATESYDLVFDHLAYVDEQQVRFKEMYYGYENAVESWKRLQRAKKYPLPLKEYFPWVHDDAMVDTVGTDAVSLSDINKILWLRTDSIGDNILASSMLSRITECYPGLNVAVVCQEKVVPVYENSPCVSEIIAFDRGRAVADKKYRDELLAKMRATNADLLLNTVYSRERLTDLLALESGIQSAIAFEGDDSNMEQKIRVENNRRYTKLVYLKSTPVSEVGKYVQFLQVLGVPDAEYKTSFRLTEEDKSFAEAIFKNNNFVPEKTIALFAGAQYAVRHYERYGKGIRQLCAEHGFSVIALGVHSDAQINQKNLDDSGARSINLSGKTTLRQSAALLKRCRLAIGAETGLAHLACAIGTPNVIILGGGHFGRFMPYSPLTSVVCLPLECYGCNWECKYNRVHCVSDITDAVIDAAVCRALAGSSDKSVVTVQGNSMYTSDVSAPRWRSPHRLLNSSNVTMNAVGHIPSSIQKLWKGWSNGESVDVVEMNKERQSDEAYKVALGRAQSGSTHEAIQMLENLLEDNPDYAVAHNDLGVLCSAQHETEKALAHYTTAVWLDGRNANFKKNLAELLLVEMGNIDGALEIYVELLRQSPNDGELLLHLALIAELQEKTEDAQFLYRRVLELDPENVIAKNKLVS
jgi:ADP-heptose:LPS heptosyltransferase/glycosyltransferase involved in cell wall biosynthesis/Tfp pilus assembly protein PilF